MKILGFALDLVNDPEVIASYDRYHQRIWPELVVAMKDVGVASQRIFRSGNRLFMILEVPDDFDWQQRFAQYMASTPKAAEWDALMRQLQRPAPAAKEGEWWSAMTEVYNLNDQLLNLQPDGDIQADGSSGDVHSS